MARKFSPGHNHIIPEEIPPKIVGMINWHDMIIVATERGIFKLNEETMKLEPIKPILKEDAI
jgi:hypothetical protein